MEALTSQRSAITARLKELEPFLSEVEQLNEEAATVELTMARVRAERGGSTPEDLFALTLEADKPEFFESLRVWLNRVTRSGQISLDYGPTCEMSLPAGNKLFPYLFVIDVGRGITDKLIEDIEAIANASLYDYHQDEILFRISSTRKAALVMRLVEGDIPTAHFGGVDVTTGDIWCDNTPLSIHAVFEKLARFTENEKNPARNKKNWKDNNPLEILFDSIMSSVFKF